MSSAKPLSKIAVLGPSGRMGRLVAEAVEATTDLKLTALLDSEKASGDEFLGIPITSDARCAFEAADLYIDFSTPAATRAAAQAAVKTKTAAVIGTTGLQVDEHHAIEALAQHVPVLVARNFSLGVNLLDVLVETAARALGPSYNAELVELHHKRKRDAPSGTAIALAEAVARGHDVQLSEVVCYQRHGDMGPRPDSQIGIQTIRGGDIIGDHTVFLIGEHERIEFTHRAHDRSLFADGAITAARWIRNQSPGLYTMRDMLGL